MVRFTPARTDPDIDKGDAFTGRGPLGGRSGSIERRSLYNVKSVSHTKIVLMMPPTPGSVLWGQKNRVKLCWG